MKKHKRNWFFFALRLFPLVAFCLAVHQGGAVNLYSNFETWISYFRFEFVYDILSDVFMAIGSEVPLAVLDYASYLVMVLFAQICYDVIVFLPDFARGAFERWSKV